MSNGEHLVRITSTRGDEAEFALPAGWALTVEVDGRQYVGVTMPEDGVHPVEVVVWPDEAGEENITFTPPGAALAALTRILDHRREG